LHYPAFAELLHGVRTGAAGFDRAFGISLFDYFAAHPEAAHTFDEALAGLRSQATRAMLDLVDFSAARTLVDVGGGTGSLLAAVLARYPAIQGILFDRPHVVEQAERHLRAAGMRDRCVLAGGDFFAAVPPGGDVYLLRHIVHDWDDDRAVRILACCRRAMQRPARLLLIESIVEPGNDLSLAKVFDLVMLAVTGGMERTEAEYRELCAAAGFRLTRVVPTPAGIHVIEAAPLEGDKR
jgi:hypothetical protein